MVCRIYQNVECIVSMDTDKEVSEYCCSDCVMHVAVAHDNIIDNKHGDTVKDIEKS